ncbi:hypothetical protein PC121_g22439 [Phytophthora cactorum]|nr:hypothetical protein PC121_g22439 [Phytophthora cactorum]
MGEDGRSSRFCAEFNCALQESVETLYVKARC